ncbi:CLIP domain-containing serine protease B4-like [Culex pipiens pallens]|uniref:CLIP domain-containing serine protease B4-like n=1 Tax=Culex pipiens pallens TaxID=42434 RepID=UPI0019533DEE|nr:CLIP domain-containing serine protease B4-like [Culex pipiens pallens]
MLKPGGTSRNHFVSLIKRIVHICIEVMSAKAKLFATLILVVIIVVLALIFYGTTQGKSDGKPLVSSLSTTSKKLPRPPSDCGLDSPDRIFGGTETALGEFSWTALLVAEDTDGYKSTYCGATLINSRYVVTAAHCINPINWTLTAVRLGEHNITNGEEQDCDEYNTCANVPVEVGIEKVILHEEYDANKKREYNDIALIRLNRDVGFSTYINPICLPLEDSVRQMNHTGMKVTAAGWGYTESNYSSEVKLKVSLDVMNHNRCVKVYKSADIRLQDTQLCAGGKKGEDTCGGDSGGPLMREIEGNYHLIGVVSFGAANCGTKGVPGVYTNVAMFVDWIQSKLE